MESGSHVMVHGGAATPSKGRDFFEIEKMKTIEIEKHYPEGRLVIRPYQDGSQYHLLTVDIPSDWQIYDDDLNKENPGTLGSSVAHRYGSWIFKKPKEYENMVRELNLYDGEMVPVTVAFKNERMEWIFKKGAELEFNMIDFIRTGIHDISCYRKQVASTPIPKFLEDGYTYTLGPSVGWFPLNLSEEQQLLMEFGALKLGLTMREYATACIKGLAEKRVRCAKVRLPKNPVHATLLEIDAHIMSVVKKAAGKQSWQSWCQCAIVDMLEGMGVEA